MMSGMVSGVYWEWSLLLKALRLGIYIAVLYDVIKIVRMILPHKNLMTSLEDLVYWMYVTALTMELQFAESDGVLRGFAVMGMVTGMVFYNTLLGKRLLRPAEKITDSLKRKLTKIGERFKIKLCKQRNVFMIHRRAHGKKTNPNSEEAAEQTGNAVSYHGRIDYDSGGSH